jgi:hypothetical protein
MKKSLYNDQMLYVFIYRYLIYTWKIPYILLKGHPYADKLINKISKKKIFIMLGKNEWGGGFLIDAYNPPFILTFVKIFNARYSPLCFVK